MVFSKVWQVAMDRTMYKIINYLPTAVVTANHPLFSIAPRSDEWWSEIVLRTFTERDWTEIFRMRKETFTYLCQQLSRVLRRKDTRLRNAISVEKRVVVTLWCLATPYEYRTIVHLFGIARSTVSEIVQETCKLLVLTLSQVHSFSNW